MTGARVTWDERTITVELPTDAPNGIREFLKIHGFTLTARGFWIHRLTPFNLHRARKVCAANLKV